MQLQYNHTLSLLTFISFLKSFNYIKLIIDLIYFFANLIIPVLGNMS